MFLIGYLFRGSGLINEKNNSIKLNGNKIRHSDAILGAFSGENFRGSVEPTHINDTLSIYFLTVYGSNTDTISFQFYDPNTLNIFSVHEVFYFQTNAIWGTPSEPFG